ncbi:YfeC-like transcriptional regulator [Acerihabitans arboris]|uniref:Putative DNA-binding transcriptional regulator n=1 Tax=Acerihabitans arboris TaxID=2691583 RepID=A0A845S9K2_9GAMM|nr:YfeC-like transcriptional regulator [Acerihabitans arboris]NDL61410.1 putative DNA-binding transcriptional regulator [Acerihabitans arboris]
MKKAWFKTSELIGIAKLPGTRQGITARARRENWTSRPMEGVQGKGLEFALESLPLDVQQELTRRQMQETPFADYRVNPARVQLEKDPLGAWMAIYHQFQPQERDEVISLLLREGITGFMARLGITPGQ